jgi:rhodanese-related sulfurtransferase
LFDVREHGQYGEGHLFYAAPLPYSRLERDVARLAPNPRVRVVVYDGGDADGGGSAGARRDASSGNRGGIAEKAVRALGRLGYSNVHQLEGGAAAWARAGHTLFKGVNVPSKTFGELVEAINHTPHISAAELAQRQSSGEPLVILDGRPFDEYRVMSIPGGVCCPNGELALRLEALVPDPSTPIVVNCAGRTRSIIGAQTLINLGVRNPVLALENGTQGWFLAGLELEHGQQRRYPADAAATPSVDRIQAARALAQRAGVEWVNAKQVKTWAADANRSVFLCDVRSPEEFSAGSLPGAQSTPGGQLQQAVDQYVGVRNGTLVLFDNDGIRAAVTASWLRQQGWRAYVLEEGLKSGAGLPLAPVYLPAPLPLVTADVLAQGLKSQSMHVLDLRSSQAYRDGHIPGSRWSIRPRLPEVVRGLGSHVVLVCDDHDVAAWAAEDMRELGISDVRILKGGVATWMRSNHDMERSPDTPSDEQRIDHLFFTAERHAGNRAAAKQYLAWELGLLDQLDPQERAGFKPLRSTV